jgi:hypothetical protein
MLKVQQCKWIVAAGLVLLTPIWANGWMAIKIQEPPERWEVVTMPRIPAPFENPGSPLRFSEQASLWSYPTEVEFVAYPEQLHYNWWVTQALEKYQIRLLSPIDLPYTLAPLAVR